MLAAPAAKGWTGGAFWLKQAGELKTAARAAKIVNGAMALDWEPLGREARKQPAKDRVRREVGGGTGHSGRPDRPGSVL